MVILGLTGCIAMGKSAAADMFRRLGVRVHDADEAVHRLLERGGGAVTAVAAAFPGAARDGAIDREVIAKQVFGDKEALRRLERILHPLVRNDQRSFLATAARRGDSLVVLDVPLLFETGGHEMCDAVAVVSAPPFVQTERLLKRPGMTRERIKAIRGLQMSDREKRRRADYVIPTGLGRDHTMRRIRRIVNSLSTKTKARAAHRIMALDRTHGRLKGGHHA